MDEILLQAASYRAKASPYGASLRELWMESPSGRRDLAWGYSGRDAKKGGQGDVLIPFPGRVSEGRYWFGGETHQLERNDKEGPNAIHGFVRTREWSARASDASASFRLRLDESEFAPRGYPFSLDIAVAYSLSEQGLACELSIQNTGKRPAPAGAGFHPYFTVGTPSIDTTLLTLPARTVLEFGAGLLPTGRLLPVEGTELDFRHPRPIGPLKLNHCFGDLARDSEGIARLELRDPRGGARVELWMDRAFGYLVAYTGDALGAEARKALALEPMTCATDAFNRPEWGLVTLAPDEFFRARWGVAGG
ncbi:MAG: aldose epimerase [Oligoflexia bacterium]|nr:aldose epimerase [Oligoflexia bacterium]